MSLTGRLGRPITVGLQGGRLSRYRWASFAVVFWGSRYPVDGDQKKLAEEG